MAEIDTVLWRRRERSVPAPPPRHHSQLNLSSGVNAYSSPSRGATQLWQQLELQQRRRRVRQQHALQLRKLGGGRRLVLLQCGQHLQATRRQAGRAHQLWGSGHDMTHSLKRHRKCKRPPPAAPLPPLPPVPPPPPPGRGAAPPPRWQHARGPAGRESSRNQGASLSALPNSIALEQAAPTCASCSCCPRLPAWPSSCCTRAARPSRSPRSAPAAACAASRSVARRASCSGRAGANGAI